MCNFLQPTVTTPLRPTQLLQHHIIQYLTISHHIISYYIISYHIISYHIILYHILSYHIIPHLIISYHSISYHNRYSSSNMKNFHTHKFTALKIRY